MMLYAPALASSEPAAAIESSLEPVKEGSVITADADGASRSLGDRYDPFHEPQLSDPYAFFAEARAAAPVLYSAALDCWIVTRYRDVKEVMQNWKLFSAGNTLDTLKPLCPHAQQALAAGGFRPVKALTNADPPAHTRVRRLANAAFTPRRVAQMEPFIRTLAARFVEQRLTAGRADLIHDLAWDLPALVIFSVIGVPEADMARVKASTGNRVLMNWGYPSDEEQVQLARDSAGFWRYAEAMVAERVKTPRDDFTSDLVGARDGDLPALTVPEVTTVLFSLLTAGHETTTSLLGNAFLWLLRHREAWQDVCNDRSLIPNAVEEVLRIEPSVFSWRRRTLHPALIGGVAVPAHANLLALLGSANRDPEIFEQPERFDIRRRNAKDHLAFGHGPHVCLGAPLARLEARVVIEELSARLPGLRLVAGQKMSYLPNTSFRGPRSLAVEWDA
jgi:cytochrome P450